MKIFSRACLFLMAFSFAMPAIAAPETDTKKESTIKKVGRLPFAIGKNLFGGVMIVGIGVTAVCAYLWLVEKVNAGGLNMTMLNASQQYLEKFSDLGRPREQLEWLKIELYKNIDIATIVSGAATLASGVGYILFKSFDDVLQ